MLEDPRYAILTLGCKTNQYESAAIAWQLEQHGYRIAAAAREADVCIINTCAVTHSTEAQSRQLIRHLLKENPRCRIIVTGCYAQTSPEAVAALSERIEVLGNIQKDELPAFLKQTPKSSSLCIHVSDIAVHHFFTTPACPSFRNRTRALLKIQDGCNSTCSYCIVPSVRGPSRSLPLPLVLERLSELVNAGYKEIVLTGIHLGAYGRDLHPRVSLSLLLKKIEATYSPAPVRIRLSSLEPPECTDELIGIIAESHTLCPHLHIPLQSGDNALLKAMHRTYTADAFEALLERVLSAIPNVNIGLDVIAGLPGETDRQFENTLSLITRHAVGYLHVFPFSRRRGTPAASLPGQVPDSLKKERVRILRALGFQKRQDFWKAQCLHDHLALIENRHDNQTGKFKAVTRNYIPVQLSAPCSYVGEEVRIKMVQPTDGYVEAVLLVD